MTPETMPPLFHTGHMIHFLNRPLGEVYIYDSADDGPECEVITRILAAHPRYRMGEERRSIESMRLLDRTSLLFYERQYDELGSKERDVVNRCVTKYIEMKGA